MLECKRPVTLSLTFDMVTIKCRTQFDITATGVRSYFKESRIPFQDQAGNNIKDMQSWIRSRNQQRNWETINQIISLRTLPENITNPTQDKMCWQFEFSVPDLSSLGDSQDSVKLLKNDAAGVPMILGLDEQEVIVPYIISQDNQSNIWFELAKLNIEED